MNWVKKGERVFVDDFGTMGIVLGTYKMTGGNYIHDMAKVRLKGGDIGDYLQASLGRPVKRRR